MNFIHTTHISVIWRCVLACPSPSSSDSSISTSNPQLFIEWLKQKHLQLTLWDGEGRGGEGEGRGGEGRGGEGKGREARSKRL